MNIKHRLHRLFLQLKERLQRRSTPTQATTKTASQAQRTTGDAASQAQGTSPGQWHKQMFIKPAISPHPMVTKLDYFVYTPASATAGAQGLPLVVMLHGCKQTAFEFASGTRMNQLAEEYGFVVLYPQQSMFNNLNKCWRWYDLKATAGLAEAHSIMSIIHSVIEQQQLDAQRVVVAGLSAGAGMASLLAATFADEIAAIALHSGPALALANNVKSGLDLMKHGPETTLLSSLTTDTSKNGADDANPHPLHEPLAGFKENFANATVPALILQGTEDKVVHPNNATALAHQWAYLNGLSDSGLKKSDSGNEHAPDAFTHQSLGPLVELIRIPALGHAWSGGDASYNYHATQGPEASRLICEFFAKHTSHD